ncbi:MAG TPA: hypothetical protein ENF63_00065 [Candidatus Bathyarchaeota archaeon]|nr:hypothetical protein [Candidatus Bathyarchaeota archaeon]
MGIIAMSEEEEKVKKLVEFREKLERRIAEVRQELEGLQNLMEIIDDFLIEKGFKRPEISGIEKAKKEKEKIEAPAGYMEFPIKTPMGEKLATIYIGDEVVRVVLNKDKNFRDNIPPFRQFLIDRVLLKMQEKDREAARKGEITPDKILSYSIVKEGDVIKEIIIRNVSEERIRDLKSSIRWTLEKMYEKMVSM